MWSPTIGPICSPACRTSPRDGLAAALLDAGEAPLRVAGEVAHQVEGVRAEHHQVFAAAALVLLAVAAKFEHVADLALRDQVLDDLHARAVRGLVGDGDT